MKKMKDLDEHVMRSRADLPYLFTTTDNLMHCQSCKRRLSFWKMFFHAVGRKKGSVYKVRCRCGHVNEIEKGRIAQDLNKRWEDVT